MRKGILLTAALLLATGVVLAADAKEELAKPDGTWEASSVTRDGKELPAEKVKAIKLTIKDGKYTYDFGGKSISGTMKLDPSATPKAVDAEREGGTVRKGIYEVTADSLKICLAEVDKDRPTKFDAGEGTGNQLTTFKKAK